MPSNSTSNSNIPMAQIIAIMMYKGGSGKSTTAINLGAILVEMGLRVLLVDLDRQGNATTGVGLELNEVAHTVNDLFANPELHPREAVTETDFGLHVLAASRGLAKTAMNMSPGDMFNLREALARVADDYDVILIDTPPNEGYMTYSALVFGGDPDAGGGHLLLLSGSLVSEQFYVRGQPAANGCPQPPGSVVDRLDPPVAAGQSQQVGGALVGGGLEADQAAVGGRVPPALVDQPGAGPGGDGRPGPAADPDPARQRAEQAAAVDRDGAAGGVHHLRLERLGVHDRRGGSRHLSGPRHGPRSGRAGARPAGPVAAGTAGGVEGEGTGRTSSPGKPGNLRDLGARPAPTTTGGCGNCGRGGP
jgi:hypothetical protein